MPDLSHCRVCRVCRLKTVYLTIYCRRPNGAYSVILGSPSLMQNAVPAVSALLFASALLLAAPARAQESDRALLSTFCEPAQIRASTCKRAKLYPEAGRRRCDVTLSADRYRGRFVASANPLLVAAYDSGCEAHVTDNGGEAVFEQVGGTYIFRGFQPGMQTKNCVTLASDAGLDRLVCLTGHMGQGELETGVARMGFAQDTAKRISMSLDLLLTAEDSIGAYGANVVTCKEPLKYFEVSKIRAGPRRDTVTVDASYADAETIRIACGKGFPRPKEIFGELAPGDAYVPEGHAKRGKLMIDVVTRKVTPQ